MYKNIEEEEEEESNKIGIERGQASANIIVKRGMSKGCWDLRRRHHVTGRKV